MLKNFIFVSFLMLSCVVVTAAQKARPDLERDDLKGKVKTVSVDTERGTAQKRLNTFVRHYDEKGFLSRHIWADMEGKPVLTVVFGFDNSDKGKRASMLEDKEAGAKIKPAYTSFYAYRYDARGRVIEEKITEKTGAQSSRNVYTYAKNKRTTKAYNKDNAWVNTLDETLDAAGNPTAQTSTWIIKGKPAEIARPTTMSIKYEAFDKKGNWTKRTITTASEKNKASYTEHRTIEYY